MAASHPRVQLHVTPTDSSWLNLVERFIAELTTQVAAPQEPSQRPGVGAVDPPLGRHLECQSAAVRVTKTADEILDTSPPTAATSTTQDTNLDGTRRI